MVTVGGNVIVVIGQGGPPAAVVVDISTRFVCVYLVINLAHDALDTQNKRRSHHSLCADEAGMHGWGAAGP